MIDGWGQKFTTIDLKKEKHLHTGALSEDLEYSRKLN